MNYKMLVGVFIVFCAKHATAQDLTHPTDMNLPDYDFVRPEPSDYARTTDSGLTAYLATADQVPLVTLSAFIRAGKIDDVQQGAIESLVVALKRGGSTARTAADFKSSLEQMTGEYKVQLHNEWMEISLNIPSEDLIEGAALFANIILNPGISQSAIDTAAANATPSNANLAGESGPALYEGSLNATVELFHDTIYAGHPYGYSPSREDFSKLSVDDVARFHNEYFVPGNIVIAVAGKFDSPTIESFVDELADQLPSGKRPDLPTIPALRGISSAQHSFPADKLQSWLVFGHDLPLVLESEQAALDVMNYILAGGHLWTRMTIETRYKYGYTNDASGFLEPHWYGPGSYTFRSYSRPEVIKNIYDNMMDEVYRIRSEEVADQELFVAKGALTDGSFPIQYLDGYAIARTFALEKLRYENHDRSASYIDRIRNVSKEDVLEAAKKYLRPDEMQIVLMGDDIDLSN